MTLSESLKLSSRHILDIRKGWGFSRCVSCIKFAKCSVKIFAFDMRYFIYGNFLSCQNTDSQMVIVIKILGNFV